MGPLSALVFIVPKVNEGQSGDTRGSQPGALGASPCLVRPEHYLPVLHYPGVLLSVDKPMDEL